MSKTSPKIIANDTILYSRTFELREVVDMLEQEDAEEVLKIYTLPPAVNVNSDEDSGEEDGGGFIDSLSRQQLRAPVEAILQNGRLDGVEAKDTNAGDEAAEVSAQNLPQTNQTNSK